MAYSSLALTGFVTCLAISKPRSAPISCARINAKTDEGDMPTIEEVKTLPIVIAGFANAVLDVKIIAPKIQMGT
jgi:hypothetical protein